MRVFRSLRSRPVRCQATGSGASARGWTIISKPVELPACRNAGEMVLPARCARRGAICRSGRLEAAVAIFDADAFLKRLMGDRQLAGAILKGFLEDFPAHLNLLRKRLEEADRCGAGRQAHALVGSSATVSAGGLCEIAREMERAAGAGELDEFEELLPQANEAFQQFKSTLEHASWL